MKKSLLYLWKYINNETTLYINQTNETASYLKLKFNYTAPNTHGIGTKVYSYVKGQLQFKELYTVRGFQSSSQRLIHFGYGQVQNIDSIKIVWPDKTFQVLKNVKTNQELVVSKENTAPFNYGSIVKRPPQLFKKEEHNLMEKIDISMDRWWSIYKYIHNITVINSLIYVQTSQ